MARLFIISLLFSFLNISAFPAAADVFVWQDPVSKMSVSAPDTWRRGHNQKPDDVITIVAPGGNQYASCRLRARDDRRFVIFPQAYGDEIQRQFISQNFWVDYLGEYDDFKLEQVIDNAGLGRGFASFAEATYKTPTSPAIKKRAVMYASLYNDTLHIVECSAEHSVFDNWHRSFNGIFKSVDFRKEHHNFPTGHYRPFLGVSITKINGVRAQDSYYHSATVPESFFDKVTKRSFWESFFGGHF